MILLSWAALADYLQEHPNGFWPWLSTFRTAVRACPQNPKMDCLSLTLPLLQTQPQHFCILRQCKLQENKRIPKTGLWKYQPEMSVCTDIQKNISLPKSQSWYSGILPPLSHCSQARTWKLTGQKAGVQDRVWTPAAAESIFVFFFFCLAWLQDNNPHGVPI